MDGKFEGWPHVVKSQQFSRTWFEKELFPTARRMKRLFHTRCSKPLHGKKMATVFYQPSTRTRASFEMAHDFLGGRVVFSTENAKEFSSAAKGESFRHTIQVFKRYQPDIIILRHHEEGAAELAASLCEIPVINAGDGPGQHPTQAMLDIFTITERLGGIDGISIAIVGDLAKNRAARSLAYCLAKFNGVTIHFVSPRDQQMKQDVRGYLRDKKVEFFEWEDINLVAARVDVIYMLRAQTEHGSAKNGTYDEQNNQFFLDRRVAAIAKPSAVFLHPLPIDSAVCEIRPELEDDKRSVFLNDQVDSGMFVRAALLEMILARQPIGNGEENWRKLVYIDEEYIPDWRI